MFHAKDPSKIVRNVYSNNYGCNYISEVDIQDIKAMLDQLTLSRAKIILIGNELLSQIDENTTKPITE